MKKKRGKTMCFKNRFEALMVMFLVGLVGVCAPVVMAESDDGRVNANDNVLAMKRDPFWPIGHTPESVMRSSTAKMPNQARKGTGTIDWEEAMKRVVINGVSNRAENEYIAVINSEVKSVGETVSTLFKGIRYSWTVESITPPGSVKLRRHTAEQENI